MPAVDLYIVDETGKDLLDTLQKWPPVLPHRVRRDIEDVLDEGIHVNVGAAGGNFGLPRRLAFEGEQRPRKTAPCRGWEG